MGISCILDPSLYHGFNKTRPVHSLSVLKGNDAYLVKTFVDARVVQEAMDPVDSTVGKEQEGQAADKDKTPAVQEWRDDGSKWAKLGDKGSVLRSSGSMSGSVEGRGVKAGGASSDGSSKSLLNH